MQLEQLRLPKCQRLHQNYDLGRNLCQKASLVKTDFVQNVVSGGTMSTTLGADMPTCHNSPKYMLNSYIDFSEYLLQLASPFMKPKTCIIIGSKVF
jgi:hypothetical protein